MLKLEIFEKVDETKTLVINNFSDNVYSCNQVIRALRGVLGFSNVRHSQNVESSSEATGLVVIILVNLHSIISTSYPRFSCNATRNQLVNIAFNASDFFSFNFLLLTCIDKQFANLMIKLASNYGKLIKAYFKFVSLSIFLFYDQKNKTMKVKESNVS